MKRRIQRSIYNLDNDRDRDKFQEDLDEALDNPITEFLNEGFAEEMKVFCEELSQSSYHDVEAALFASDFDVDDFEDEFGDLDEYSEKKSMEIIKNLLADAGIYVLKSRKRKANSTAEKTVELHLTEVLKKELLKEIRSWQGAAPDGLASELHNWIQDICEKWNIDFEEFEAYFGELKKFCKSKAEFYTDDFMETMDLRKLS